MNILDDADKIIEIITAYKNGGPDAVEYRRGVTGSIWLHPHTHPGWDFQEIKWRLTPSPPKPREWWISSSRIDLAVPYFHQEEPANKDFIHVIEVLPAPGEQKP